MPRPTLLASSAATYAAGAALAFAQELGTPDGQRRNTRGDVEASRADLEGVRREVSADTLREHTWLSHTLRDVERVLQEIRVLRQRMSASPEEFDARSATTRLSNLAIFACDTAFRADEVMDADVLHTLDGARTSIRKYALSTKETFDLVLKISLGLPALLSFLHVPYATTVFALTLPITAYARYMLVRAARLSELARLLDGLIDRFRRALEDSERRRKIRAEVEESFDFISGTRMRISGIESIEQASEQEVGPDDNERRVARR
jgi:hypothetical protein